MTNTTECPVAGENKNWRHWLQSEAGISVIELLVGLVLVGILGMAVLSTLRTSQRAGTKAQDTARVMAEARTAVDRLSRQLRPARKLMPGSDARTLVFWLDDDRDAMPDADEVHTWEITDAGDGTASIRSWTHDDPSVVQVVARDLVPADAFTYEGALSQARSVRIQFGFARGAPTTSDFVVDTTVALRNAPLVEATP